jgi:hypothetical protein
MSRKSLSSTVSVLAKSVFALGFAVGALQSCGSSSGSDPVALCQQGCDKAAMCTPDGGAIAAAGAAACKSDCAASTGSVTKCSNLSAIESAYKACLAMDCATFENCIETTLPACATGTGGSNGAGTGGSNGAGSGGSNGTGTGGSNGGGAGTGGPGGSNGGGAGTNGAGGGSGTGNCSSCTKGQACCVGALQSLGQDAGVCSFSVTTCNSLSGASQSSYISACATEITAGAALGVAGCQ